MRESEQQAPCERSPGAFCCLLDMTTPKKPSADKTTTNGKGVGGRPSKYKPEYDEQAGRLCMLGATDAEMADFFGISVRTLYRWKTESESFCQALNIGKEHADARVKRSLYMRATGYDFTEQQAFKVKVSQHEEKVEVVDVDRHMPPDTTAAIFWLKNRDPRNWRDRVEHTGADGGPITVAAVDLTDDELAAIAAGRRI